MMSALSQALSHIRRSPYQALSAVLLVWVTFFVGYVLSLFLVGSDRVLQYFETRPQVTAFFTQTTPQALLEQYKTDLMARPEVTSVKLVSQDEALEIYRQQIGNDPLLLELVTADILPPSLEVSTRSLDDLAGVAENVRSLEGIDEVVYQKDIVDSLRYWTTLLRQIGIGTLAIFSTIAGLVIVVITSMRIASRRGEIRIMRLMGATKWYIQQPFLLEGALYGIVGSILGWATAYVLVLYASPMIQSFFAEVALVPVPWEFMAALLGVGTTVGLILGFAASFLSTRRLFRV
jgi:cell division transport system permease protein